ncbi:hypothetical protein C8R43DRAFT_962564 [Mycena crocata]|nr:hypothetical protein C8R43DRAFT_962564 [Mycena crocata]
MAMLSFVAAPVVLFDNALLGTVLVISVSVLSGTAVVLGISGMGRHARRPASFLVIGVAGGAAFPPIQGAIADKYNTRVSYGVSAPAFAFLAFFAAYIWDAGDRQIILKKIDSEYVTMPYLNPADVQPELEDAMKD